MKLLTIFFILWAPSLIYGQNETRRCGLPENITHYPDFAQEEIKSVWKNYVPGTKCDKELLIMDDILTVLDMFDTEVPGGLSSIATTKQQTTNTASIPESTTTHEPEATTTNFEQSVSETVLNTAAPTPDTPEAFDKFTNNATETSVSLSFASSVTAPISAFSTTDSLDNQPNPTQKNFAQPPDDAYDDDDIERVPLYEMETKFPFLEGASKKVVKAFYNVVNDPNIPSEGLRQELIHILAVSYLNDDQLQQFNSWSTARRKRIAAREKQLRGLSFRAQDSLKRLALMDSSRQKDAVEKLPSTLKRELRNHARKLVAQRRT
uniref:Uncharacterized protein n=1 Tax=Panagrolaimus sp. JU765 TaxID=591449 RepID=A0AC34Q5V4_9BILA